MSTDKARNERLIALAMRVWPELEQPEILTEPEWTGPILSGATLDDGGIEYIHIHPHPNALDALEVALVTLSINGHLREREPAWVETLAKEWEEKARRSAQGQCAEPSWADVATKLRECAKEGT